MNIIIQLISIIHLIYKNNNNQNKIKFLKVNDMVKSCLKSLIAAGLCKHFRDNGPMKSAKQT